MSLARRFRRMQAKSVTNRYAGAGGGFASGFPGGQLPDIGTTFWDQGRRDAELIFIFPEVQMISPRCDNLTDVTFVQQFDESRMMGTLTTRQSEATVKSLVSSGKPLQITGILDAEVVAGASGERYRCIVGRIERV